MEINGTRINWRSRSADTRIVPRQLYSSCHGRTPSESKYLPYSYHNSALLDQICFEIIWARQGIRTTALRQ
jgi:hypothetical protein